MIKPTTSDVDLRPIDLTTGKPIGPLRQPGYYRGFSTLQQQKFWDAKTREVIRDRVDNVPPIRFFDADSALLLEVICDRLLPQDDRDERMKVPIVPQIDKRLFENVHDGYRYEHMPPDPEAFRLGLQAIDEMARARYERRFVELEPPAQEALLKSLHDGKPSPDNPIWQRMPAHRFFMMVVGDCVDAYYSHPYAWDEIGFGGPAYPRAYMRLEHGQPEPWEVNERRYEWAPPERSLSARYEPVAGEAEQLASPGQGGTH